MDKSACAACGSDRVEPGLLASAALWLDVQSGWSKAVGGTAVKLVACLDCGHLSLWSDPEALRKLLPADRQRSE